MVRLQGQQCESIRICVNYCLSTVCENVCLPLLYACAPLCFGGAVGPIFVNKTFFLVDTGQDHCDLTEYIFNSRTIIYFNAEFHKKAAL